MRQEPIKRRHIVCGIRRKTLRRTDQLFEVLDPGLGTFAFVLLIKLEQPAGVDYMVDLIGKLETCDVFRHAFDQIQERDD